MCFYKCFRYLTLPKVSATIGRCKQSFGHKSNKKVND